MPYDATKMQHYLSHQLAGKRIALVYEAGPTGFGLADVLLTAGYSCMVVNPALVPTAKGKRVRTNRLDAQKLAYQLRGGHLKGILVPSPIYRQLRELVTLRKMHMTESAKCKQRITALFLRHGLVWPRPKQDGLWNNALFQQLQDYPCDPILQYKLKSLVEQVLYSRRQALQTQQQLRRFVEATPELEESVRYAMSLPGIGWIVATYAIARIGYWRALVASEQMASFSDWCKPRIRQGAANTRGSITKAGDPVMRSLFIEAAWTTIRHDEELREFYQRIKENHAKDKAARICHCGGDQEAGLPSALCVERTACLPAKADTSRSMRVECSSSPEEDRHLSLGKARGQQE